MYYLLFPHLNYDKSMIEVEKKFILTPEQEKSLIEGAEFLGEKQFTDIYYDDKDFSLTTKDIWFRQRDGRFELKLPMNVSLEERVSDQYKEIEDEKEIKKYFNFNNDASLSDLLKEREYESFCIMTTIRKKYKKEDFGIDMDIVDFGYAIAEIEYMAQDNSNLQQATDKIIEFAKKHNLTFDELTRGKGSEYIRRNNPKHFQALIDVKVIK